MGEWIFCLPLCFLKHKKKYVLDWVFVLTLNLRIGNTLSWLTQPSVVLSSCRPPLPPTLARGISAALWLQPHWPSSVPPSLWVPRPHQPACCYSLEGLPITPAEGASTYPTSRSSFTLWLCFIFLMALPPPDPATSPPPRCNSLTHPSVCIHACFQSLVASGLTS